MMNNIKTERKNLQKNPRKRSIIKIALCLRRNGFSVIPVDRNKKALIEWKKYQSRIATKEEVRSWWSKFPRANIAIVTGKISNLTVIDCDSPAAIKKVESYLDDSCSVPTVDTPRGRHFYYRYNPEIRSYSKKGTELHIKSEGGYVLCPPSQTKNGFYSWNSRFGPDSLLNLSPIPERLQQYLKTQVLNSPDIGDETVRPLSIGRRDNDIFHIALQLGKGGDPEEYAQRIALKLAKACNPPFPEEEALRKVQSAYKRIKNKNYCPIESISVVKQRFSDCQPEAVQWLMQNKIPMGMLTAFVGDPGEGKTFLAIEIASRISRGEPLPGSSRALVSGYTVYLSAENPLNFVLVPRALACGADMTKLIHIPAVKNDLDETFIFDVTKHIPVLEKEFSENQDIKLVVVDPIISHLGDKIDTCNQLQVRRAMDLLSNFAEKTGVAVIAIMHMNKSQASGLIYRASGSVQFIAAAKAAWLITRDPYDPDGARRLFMPIKSNLSPDRSSLAFRIEPYPLTFEGGHIDPGKVVIENDALDIDVADIMSPENLQEKTQIGHAMSFLVDFLGDGPKPTVELEKRGDELGFNKNTLKKARTKLGVQCEKNGMHGGWTCFLPERRIKRACFLKRAT
jgi:putative DNA primase/helicase